MTNGLRIPSDDIDFFLSQGIWAPSADNLQPWSFKILDNAGISKILFYLDKSRLNNFCDTGLLTPYVSAGAVIENIRISAEQKGYLLNAEAFPDPNNPYFVAEMTFTASTTKGSPLSEWIPIRVTNRNFYEPNHIIPETVYKDLIATVKKNRGFDLKLIKRTEENRFDRLNQILGMADQIRFENQRLHRELFEVMRLDHDAVQKTSDGLDIRSLDAGPGSPLFFKLISAWPRLKMLNTIGLSRFFNLYAKLQMQSSPAVGLITAPSQTPKDYLLGGQIMQRIWLSLASQEIAMQPMEALPIFIINLQQNGGIDFSEKHLTALKGLKEEFFKIYQLSDQNGLIMLFRFGYAKKLASAHSPRRALASLMIP